MCQNIICLTNWKVHFNAWKNKMQDNSYLDIVALKTHSWGYYARTRCWQIWTCSSTNQMSKWMVSQERCTKVAIRYAVNRIPCNWEPANQVVLALPSHSLLHVDYSWQVDHLPRPRVKISQVYWIQFCWVPICWRLDWYISSNKFLYPVRRSKSN